MPSTAYKPASLPVFPPHGNPDGDCVLRRLLQDEPRRRAIDWPERFPGGIAHRLDVATSGALVVADDLEDLARIRTWFTEKLLHKTYLLLACKDVPWSENTCDRSIAHDKRNRRKMVVQRGANTPHRGKWHAAQTRFRRVEGRRFEATMRSGVMHQIRVHAAFVGIPILGDRQYGGGAVGEGHLLHHVGLEGPDGFRTDPVPMPAWTVSPRAPR